MDFENPNHLLAAVQKVRSEYLRGALSASISDQQAASTREQVVRGPVWVSKFTLPAPPPNDNSRELLLSQVDEANDRHIRYDRPQSEPLHCQWLGYRKGVGKDAPEPTLSEHHKFQQLSNETKGPLAILYIYGGTFVLNSPDTYRKIASSLAHSTAAKVFMVRQRLAPQSPFPAALLDVFQAYLALVAPPPGCPHAPISPSSIVVAGDSSGSCLALGLLQLLLQLQRRKVSISFHGSQINPMVPAGMALLSVVADLSNALPAFERNAKSDIFPVPIEKLPYLEKDFPICSAWPSSPPRANLYCEAGMLAHPLASPAASDDWTGSCPLWFASGQEQTVDATRLVGQTAHSQGVSVTLQEYENMPHTFFWIFPQAPQTSKILNDWFEAIISFGSCAKPKSSASFVRAKRLQVEPLAMESLVPFTAAAAREMMRQKTLGYNVPTFHRLTRPSL